MYTESNISEIYQYTLFASFGRKVRKATAVKMDDGKKIFFTEKLTKKEAIKNALYQLNK